MAQKHLRELLQEDQEPFQLKHFIADRRSQLKKLDDKIVKKQKLISNTTLLCKHACFFSVRDQSSPCPEKLSPINFHHSSPSATRKSPMRRMNSLHIPAKTSSLLLEAAMRIQQRQNHQPKPKKTQMGFSLFGSILKKIMSKKNNIITTTNVITTRREQTTSTTTTGADEPRRGRQSSSSKGCSEERMMKTDKTTGTTELTSRRQFSSTTTGCSGKRMGIDDETCSCNHSRLSSSGWSETNETSSSCCRSDTEENELDNAVIINGDFGSCESPLSPFRFSLQKCPSSTGCRTPEFAPSPAASPVCHKIEDEENYDDLANIEQEEDEKEQCSPVSVLDPPFDDDDGHEICEYEYEDEDEDEEVDDDCCNYALVQRAQQQLLYKLRRFEKLAELDPIELEKLMLDEEEEGNDDLVDDIDDDDSMLSYKDRDFETFASEVTIPFDMKRLVSDLISEEEKTETKSSNKREEEVVFGRVCKRLDSWQHVRSDTIDMMIESDLKNELDAWKKFQEQREETALEVEVEIFRLLVEELAEEIVYFDGHYGISNEVLA